MYCLPYKRERERSSLYPEEQSQSNLLFPISDESKNENEETITGLNPNLSCEYKNFNLLLVLDAFLLMASHFFCS